jgi:hypothetical protein
MLRLRVRGKTLFCVGGGSILLPKVAGASSSRAWLCGRPASCAGLFAAFAALGCGKFPSHDHPRVARGGGLFPNRHAASKWRELPAPVSGFAGTPLPALGRARRSPRRITKNNKTPRSAWLERAVSPGAKNPPTKIVPTIWGQPSSPGFACVKQPSAKFAARPTTGIEKGRRIPPQKKSAVGDFKTSPTTTRPIRPKIVENMSCVPLPVSQSVLL